MERLTVAAARDLRQAGGGLAHVELSAMQLLGSGAFGVVYRAEMRIDGGATASTPVAVKISQLGEREVMERSAAWKECRLLAALKHACIVAAYFRFTLHTAHGRSVGVVLERCATSMRDWLTGLNNTGARVGLEQARVASYQLWSALSYLRRSGVYHLDVTPNNVLLADVHTMALRLADFSASVTARADDVPPTTAGPRYVIGRWYRPPEVVLGARSYAHSMDAWSAGCVTGELIESLSNGHRPLFQGARRRQFIAIQAVLGTPSQQQLEAMVPGFAPLPATFPVVPAVAWLGVNALGARADPTGADLVARVLRYEPDERLDADAALRHAFHDPVRTPGYRLPGGIVPATTAMLADEP